MGTDQVMMDPDLISQADHIPVLIEPILKIFRQLQVFGSMPPLVLVATLELCLMLGLNLFSRLIAIQTFFHWQKNG